MTRQWLRQSALGVVNRHGWQFLQLTCHSRVTWVVPAMFLVSCLHLSPVSAGDKIYQNWNRCSLFSCFKKTPLKTITLSCSSSFTWSQVQYLFRCVFSDCSTEWMYQWVNEWWENSVCQLVTGTNSPHLSYLNSPYLSYYLNRMKLVSYHIILLSCYLDRWHFIF